MKKGGGVHTYHRVEGSLVVVYLYVLDVSIVLGAIKKDNLRS